jgi:hypothetical protein
MTGAEPMLEVLDRWRTLLGELGDLGRALCAAIEADDVLGAIAAMMQLRRTRAALARVEAPAQLRGERDELEAMARVSTLTVNARAAEAAMQRWIERGIPGDERLLASPLGVAVLADAMLPVVWDFEGDVVVLLGAALEPAAELFGALGQHRLVIIGAEQAADGAHAVASIDEAVLAVRTMIPGPPVRMAVRAALGTDPAIAEDLVGKLRNALADLRIHRNTVRAFSRTWVSQGLANLPALARWPSVATVGDGFAGLPMVIIAPGPSLANNVEQLRDLRGRAIVTAFSHSLKPALAAGIVPDLVLTVDPQDVRYHFDGCDLSRSCLVNAATVHPALFELPAQRFLTLSANSAIDDWLFDSIGEDAVVPGGGSVATTALSLALRWGCDPIIFVGLDLSFPGGAYYVSTSTDGAARAEIDARGMMRVAGWSSAFNAMKAGGGPASASERAVELPGWSGGVVPSSFVFSLFHRWFVARMRDLTSATVFNCTEGGAFIEGMDHRRLAEVLPLLGRQIDVGDVLDTAAMRLDAARTEHIVYHFASYLRGVRRSRRLTKIARTVISRGDAGNRLGGIEQALAAELAPLGFASLLAQREVERAHDVARRPGADTDYLAASSSLFGTLLEVLEQLEPALKTAVDRLDPRKSRGRAA